MTDKGEDEQPRWKHQDNRELQPIQGRISQCNLCNVMFKGPYE